jgi:uncharacterized protein YbjT (DUF2867 family)
MPNDNTILVLGATGRQGGAVARELLSQGESIWAMTRKPDGRPARELRTLGAHVVAADFDDPRSLEKALAGMWGVFSVQDSWEAGVVREEEQGKRFGRLARQAGVRHFVYSSVASAHRRTGIGHFESKRHIEEALRRLDLPSLVVLRPVFFMENFLSPTFRSGIEAGRLAVALEPDTRLQMIAVADIGRYGAWAFAQNGKLDGRAIDIAGDERTMPETARILSRASGHPVAFVQVPIEEVRRSSAEYAAMLAWFDRVGYNADIARTSQESGIRPTTLAEWAARVRWTATVGGGGSA